MKHLVSALVGLSTYFLIAIVIGFIFNKINPLKMPIWEYACCLTIGWGVWQIIMFVFKNVKKTKNNKR